ncbi:YjiG family protein [Enterobacter sichuanensis]|uniref:YjiG family protein n=1 Tax=Enterobacter sichuanensis TaxID=2071710 RepID=UPI000B49848A
MSAPQSNPVITDVFVEGARKGWSIATSSTLPNVVMAFIIIKALEITGALKGLGMLFAPLMGLFGLFDKGILTGEHLAILAPAIYLMGSQVQYLGRILGVIGTRARRIPLMIAISVVNAFLAMLLMRIIL